MECTEHRIAFMCCTENCTCHDPVATKITPAPTPAPGSFLEAANDANNTGRTSSSDTTAITAGVAAASGVVVLSALAYVQFRRRSHAANAEEADTAADAVQQASEVTGGAPALATLAKQESVQEV